MTAKTNSPWTPAKVSELINLYEANECLWNFNTEEYKNRMRRDEAIRKVCSALFITRQQFAKKIHNLRNQFNFELKKQKKNGLDTAMFSIKWEYFDRLMFLKNFISYRAGYGPSKNVSSESPTRSEHTNIEADECMSTIETRFIKKLDETTSTSDPSEETTNVQEYVTRRQTRQEQSHMEMPSALNLIVEEDHQYVEHSQPAISKPNTTSFGSSSETQHPAVKKLRLSKDCADSARDECDTFGEFVANELRNLNNGFTRKKMKRKIMQAMLEVWNEEEEVNINICLN